MNYTDTISACHTYPQFTVESFQDALQIQAAETNITCYVSYGDYLAELVEIAEMMGPGLGYKIWGNNGALFSKPS